MPIISLKLQALRLVLDRLAAEEVSGFDEIQAIVAEERCCTGVYRCPACRGASSRLEAASDRWSDIADLRGKLLASVTVQGDTGGTLCFLEELE